MIRKRITPEHQLNILNQGSIQDPELRQRLIQREYFGDLIEQEFQLRQDIARAMEGKYLTQVELEERNELYQSPDQERTPQVNVTKTD
ncbi:MAG: hypothetical protein OXG88_03345 [Gammaproteobacteria bacterium]|nr:hypothetical protein [Gammaproteobacteria bacterium]